MTFVHVLLAALSGIFSGMIFMVIFGYLSVETGWRFCTLVSVLGWLLAVLSILVLVGSVILRYFGYIV